MKKLITVIIAILLLTCISASALASTYIGFSGSANVRTGPGLGYESIGICNKGSTLPSLGDTAYDGRGVAWYKVSLNGRIGWVSSRYGYHTDAAGFNTYGAGGDGGSVPGGSSYSIGGSYVTAVSGQTNIRSNPSLSGSKLGVLHRGDSLAFLGSVSNDSRGVAWYKVSYRGSTGWVSSVYTTVH